MKKIILFEMIFIFCFGITFPQTRNQKTKVVTKQNVQKEPDAKLLYDQACDFYNGTNGKFMDREKAISLYKQSADMGYSVAQYELGRLYVKSLIEKKDIIYITEEEALDYLKKSAKQNNPKALYALFTIYYEGLIVPQDYSIAIYWLRLGADLEDPACIFSLGLEYQIGKMVEIDDQKAFYLIKKAANLNYVDAYEMVGNCYLHGWGVEKNINEAKQWFRKGAEKDDSGCQAALADYYIELEDDYEQAYYWYRKSADQGNTDAQYRLAEYIKMDNPNEAFYWYKKAYEKGNLNAGAELGIMLFLGKGCVKDVKKSVEILQELSEKGVTRAIAVYGKMLIDGIPGILKKNKAKGNALLQSVQDINGNIRN